MRPDLSLLMRLGAGAAAVALAGCVAAPPPPPPAARYVAPEQPMPPPPPPPPPMHRHMSGITLFPGLNFRGPATPVGRAVADVPASGMDPHVRSVHVAGGPWQLCSRPGFVGRCIVVSHSVQNLGKYGLDGVGSLRRAP